MTVTAVRSADVVAALKCELAIEVLRSSGRLTLRVTGWSMLPAVQPGDTLIVDRMGRAEVSKGDIILCARESGFFAHRVAAISDHGAVVTRGDAMPQADPPVTDSQFLGRVAFILRDGRLIEPARTLALPQRVEAGIVQRSRLAARVIMGVRGHILQLRGKQQEPALPCRS